MRKKTTPRPRRRTAPDASPLAIWLKDSGWTQVEFAAECARQGISVSQTVISRWVRGKNPSPMSRQLIARATAGGVPSSAWPEKERKRRAA